MPVSPTAAYIRLRDQSQALLGFAVLVSYAIPALRDQIDEIKTGKRASLSASDFFYKSNRSTPDELLATSVHYEQNLGSYLLLAHFSFFEAFIDDLFEEFIRFQGGEAKLIARAEKRLKRFSAPHAANIAKLKRKLQDSDKPAWQDRYRTCARKLDDLGYRFPHELFAAYGVRGFIEKAKKFRAFEIPSILVDAFGVDLGPAEIKLFHAIRDLRNGVAHGKAKTLSMKEVVGHNKALRGLAIKVSSHFSENYFVIEKYVPS